MGKPDTNIYPGAALVATGLALHGLRKGSLSRSGAAAAWVVGYGHLAGPVKVFGVAMIAFYLLGSRATKVKAAKKAELEDGPDPAKPAGNRDWVQVLSNSLPSLAAALAYRLYADATPPLLQPGLGRQLILAALGHFATCLGDTLASELGILAPSRPTHVLTLAQVPPGTNGAVSPLGLAASAAGGTLMALVMAADLAIEDASSRSWAAALQLLGFGTAAGLAGSLLDSLLGATLQRTLYSTTDGRILTDLSSKERETAPGVVTIGPGRNVLSNSAVNLISASAMAAVGFWVGGW
ncbi:hypothetical protein Q8F55_003925 [Vanrija albida]|uniref:Transmembrane protein 19 n=1 Tax=Vanrija albida TaxID=181172 RepID=A0ABR3Q5J7_9TREE